jgi:hypothetical protein
VGAGGGSLTVVALLLLALFGVLVACGSPGAGSGILEVRLRDHREAIADFQQLSLTLSGVGIHPAGQSRAEGWIELEPSLRELDLTRYVDGQVASVVQATVETGSYDAVRLTVDRASGTLKEGQPVDVRAGFGPVVLDFQVKGGRTTILRLDLVVSDVSDHPGGNYEIHIREASVVQDE